MQQSGSLPASVLASAANLFWEFGEDYHERRIEEKFIFPAVRKLRDPATRYPNVIPMFYRSSMTEGKS